MTLTIFFDVIEKNFKSFEYLNSFMSIKFVEKDVKKNVLNKRFV